MSITARPSEKWEAVVDEIKEMNERGPAGPGGHDLDREIRASRASAQAPGSQARRPERQVPRNGSRDHRPGRKDRRRHHRHQHGRPRHGHLARRQPELPGPEILRKAGVDPPEATPEQWDEALAAGRTSHPGGPREGRRPGRPAHLRHRTARGPAHRQPAPRPRRPTGRPRLVALLPFASRTT